MARKVLNRKELRDQADAAAKAGDGAAPAKKKAPAKPRASRKKDAAPVREKLFWGVYNQSMKLVAKFEYIHKKSAEKKAEDLSTSAKTPHFVQKLKEAVAE